jgi:hypothetical protein
LVELLGRVFMQCFQWHLYYGLGLIIFQDFDKGGYRGGYYYETVGLPRYRTYQLLEEELALGHVVQQMIPKVCVILPGVCFVEDIDLLHLRFNIHLQLLL